jgi:hypothetical protein
MLVLVRLSLMAWMHVIVAAMLSGMVVIMHLRFTRVVVFVAMFVQVFVAVLVAVLMSMGGVVVGMLVRVYVLMLVSVQVTVLMLSFHARTSFGNG